jgi:hypothetical protein
MSFHSQSGNRASQYQGDEIGLFLPFQEPIWAEKPLEMWFADREYQQQWEPVIGFPKEPLLRCMIVIAYRTYVDITDIMTYHIICVVVFCFLIIGCELLLLRYNGWIRAEDRSSVSRDCPCSQRIDSETGMFCIRKVSGLWAWFNRHTNTWKA